jgi:hypothetical protein
MVDYLKNLLMNEKTVSVLKGALIAAAGAGLTYLADNLGLIPLGPLSPLVAALLSVLVNAVRKAVS